MTQSLRILVVDDHRRARRSLRALLSVWGEAAEIREAGTGQEAVTLAETFQPHVVFMDARMPEMDGFEATRQIKARLPDTHVVMISMYDEFGDAAYLAGAEDFAPKGDLARKLKSVFAALRSRPGARRPGGR